MSEWTLREKVFWAVVFCVATLAFALQQESHMPPPPEAIDAAWYVQIARGDSPHVMQPFVNRQLGAQLARLVAHLFHLPVERAFTVEGFLSLLIVAAVVYGLAVRAAGPRWLLLAFVFVPWWPLSYNDMILPDLFYSALLAIMLVLLARRHLLLAALMMFPLMVARESTMLTLLCLLIALWGPLGWKGRLTAVVSAAAGTGVVKSLTVSALPNQEHLPPALYLVAKAPWNGLRATGLLPWSNLYPLCVQPERMWNVHLGPLHGFGVCGYSPEFPRMLLLTVLTMLGALPLLALAVWLTRRSLPAAAFESLRMPLVRFCLVYGAAAFLLAPLLGTNYFRLVGYGWPLFLVALPHFVPVVRRWEVAAFLVLHAAVCQCWHSWGPSSPVATAAAVFSLLAAGLLIRLVPRPGGAAQRPENAASAW